jgi:hypothetical protein
MTHWKLRPKVALWCLAALGMPLLATAATPAVPLEPIRAIVDAFKSHDMVALGEGNHGNMQINELRIALIRIPEFQDRVRDIVVEFGNSRYQDVIDRYVSGEAVPEKELRQVWEDTAQASPVWDVPVYADFYRAVRDVNASLPKSRQLRVVLGDVPFDWSVVHTTADYNAQPQRNDAFTAKRIRAEVSARRRKALLIYGEMHLLRQPPPGAPDSIVSALEKDGAKIFSIYTNALVDLAPVQADVAQWPVPSLTMIGGTTLGAPTFQHYNPFTTQFVLQPGSAAPPAPGQRPTERVVVVANLPTPATGPAPTTPMEQQFDAVLYLGPLASLKGSLPSPDLCRDKSYVAKRFSRMETVGMGAAVAQAKQYCSRIAPGSMEN